MCDDFTSQLVEAINANCQTEKSRSGQIADEVTTEKTGYSRLFEKEG
jgi:hypothetical protein